MSGSDRAELPSRERWDEVERLFVQGLELPPEQRDAFLRDACPDDSALGAEVRALLSASASLDEPGSDFLQTPAARLAAELLSDGPEAHTDIPPPPRIGPYRIVGEAGRGGMGIVYLAERELQFRQRVALKLVPRGVALDSHALRRFREERRILASLEHPHIARLLDGGVTDEGLPWFAMEYVEGMRIDRFCDAQQLPLERRLALFCQVCDAVQYAHRNLIVHRDLKPSNILVTADGTPKLLDFGIAKLLASDAEENPALTRTGARPMTPEYASPEQIRGETVSTSSDVYSLGVLLYELLTARSPHAMPEGTLFEVERRVLEEDPIRPSAAANRYAGGTAASHPTRAQVSRARGTTPERLSRRLRGDLDAIVLQALRKEPEQRYPSVAHLAGDLRRYVGGLPVSARDGTPAYRARKFFRRHRAAVAAGTAFVLLLMGFSTVTAVQSARIRAESELTAREHERAEQVAGFLVDLFRTSDPYHVAGGQTSVREVLDSGAARIGRELADQPALRAELMAVIAQAYQGLGLYGEARRLTESSLAIRQTLYAESHPAIAGSLTALGQALLAQGDYAGAESVYRRSMAARRSYEDPQIARTINSLASTLRKQGRYTEAEALLLEAMEIDRRRHGMQHADLAQTLRNLAHLHRDRGELAAAEPLYREAHRLHREQYGDEHPATANSLVNLAHLLHKQGRDTQAEPLFRQGLTVKRRLLGDGHEDVATDQAAYASLLYDLGRHAAAEQLFRETLAVQRRVWPGGHPQSATTLLALGVLLQERGDAHAAEPLLRESVAIRERMLPSGHREIAVAQKALGTALFGLGRAEEAEPLLAAAYRVLGTAGGEADRKPGTATPE